MDWEAAEQRALEKAQKIKQEMPHADLRQRLNAMFPEPAQDFPASLPAR